TTDNLIFKFKSSAFFIWLVSDMNVSILSTTTRLTDEFPFYLCRTSECFTISNLWRTYVCFYFKLNLQTVNNDIKVQFTHTCYQRLPSFFIRFGCKRRVFFS